MVTKGPEKVPNAEYTGSSTTSGTAAGNVAARTYYLDLDGNVTTKQPERGSVLVPEGDVVSEAAAALIKGAK